MKRIDVEDIRVGGEIGRRIDVTISSNLLAVDLGGDFLRPFKERSLDSGYVGLGHFLDAAARLARYSGDERLIALKERIVRELVETQGEDGYIGILAPERRLEALWDIHEMSHMICGLTTDYRLWGNEASLKAVRRLAGFLMREWQAALERAASQYVMTTLDSEPALLSLYELTGEPEYLAFCTDFLRLAEWDRPIIQGRWGRIEGHIYDYLSRCIAQLRLLCWCPEYRLTRATKRALDFMFREDGMVVTGEVGDHECWHDSQEGTIHLGETCATAYLIRLLHVLLQQTDDSFYGDVMERAIYNALLAAQSPDGRQIRYYTAFEGPRAYFGRDTYCCPNNFRRIVSELPEMVAYRTPDGLAVNLYAECSAQLTLTDGTRLGVRQETEYPSSGRVDLTIDLDRPSTFALRLRIPRWCSGVRLEVNERPVDPPPVPGRFHVIARTWQPGDRVGLDLSMAPRLIRGRQAQAGRAAIMRGPLVFCLNPERNPHLSATNPRLLAIDPGSLREDGDDCRVRAWGPNAWYPDQETEHDLLLSPFADPGGEATYFKIPVPTDRRVVVDELLTGKGGNEVPGPDFYGDSLAQDLADHEGADVLSRLQS